MSIVGVPPHYDTSPESWGRFLDEAASLHVDRISIGYVRWSEAETAAGTFRWSDFAALVADARTAGTEFVLDVATPIGLAAQLDLPPGLTFIGFADPALRARYRAMLRSALDHIAPGRVSHLTLHAEGMLEYFAAHPTHRDDFCSLLEDAIAFVHRHAPDVRVGVYWRYEDDDPALFANINRATDYAAVATALNPPGDRPQKIASIVQRYLAASPGKPVALVELGYPAAARLGSSEEAQRAFVESAAAYLRTVDPGRLEFVAWYTIFDEDRALLEPIADSLFSGQPAAKEDFLAWITSLGLQTLDGRRKPGWTQLVKELAR